MPPDFRQMGGHECFVLKVERRDACSTLEWIRMLRLLGKWTPTLIGVLFIYSGIYKLVSPGEATMALVSLELPEWLAIVTIAAATAVELYLGIILLFKVDLKYGLWMATGLIFAFTVFLWYLSTLANPPSCGCLGLTGLFKSNRADALFGVGRNVVILWLLKFAYDYYCKAPAAPKLTAETLAP